jgi:hypothetical protein
MAIERTHEIVAKRERKMEGSSEEIEAVKSAMYDGYSYAHDDATPR